MTIFVEDVKEYLLEYIFLQWVQMIVHWRSANEYIKKTIAVFLSFTLAGSIIYGGNLELTSFITMYHNGTPCVLCVACQVGRRTSTTEFVCFSRPVYSECCASPRSSGEWCSKESFQQNPILTLKIEHFCKWVPSFERLHTVEYDQDHLI